MRNLFSLKVIVVLILATSFSSETLIADSNIRDSGAKIAQLTIELGGSTKGIERRLESEGYSEIRITKSGFSSVRAQACYRGSRYIVKVKRFTGKISRSAKIGECRDILNPRDIIAKLQNEGYRRISIDQEGDIYRVVACERRRRFRIRISQYGDTQKKTDIGRCRERLDRAEVRQQLRDKNFDRIKLIKEDRQRFIFQACRGVQRVELRVRHSGIIARERKIGSCKPPINHWNIPGLLEARGFDRVVVVDKDLPVFSAEGCRKLQLIEIKFNRFGDVLKETRIGKCDPPLNEDQVFNLVRDTGANRISVKVDSSGAFVATSCFKQKMYRSRFDKYGKLYDRNNIGKCPPPPRLGQVRNDFEDRGLSKVQMFVEGCRQGRILRFKIDRFGDIINRQRLGRCK